MKLTIPLFIYFLFSLSATSQNSSIPLSGKWMIELDTLKKGHDEKWFSKSLTDQIILPSTTDEAGYGKRQTVKEDFHLNRVFSYTGPVWYQKDISIPSEWKNKRITVYLERALWKAEAWLDDQYLGSNLTLCVPHEFVLPENIITGKHKLTICIDNTVAIPQIGPGTHSYTVETQTNWNGIIGDISMHCTDPVWIDAAKVNTDLEKKIITTHIIIKNNTEKEVNGIISASITDPRNKVSIGTSVMISLKSVGKQTETDVTIPIPTDLKYWDEWQGNLYLLNLEFKSENRTAIYKNEKSITFGVRTIAVKDNQFRLNDRPIFLRGNLECCIFPKTAHPPMTIAEWDEYFKLMRSYGINTIRFHSWCPPDAAFSSADKAGFLFQIELPVWSSSVGKDSILDQFMYDEGKRILDTYGNHPCFTMLCLGNELMGNLNGMDKMVASLKNYDPHKLYTFTNDCNSFGPLPSSDYYVSFSLNKMFMRIMWNRMKENAPDFNYDFSKHISVTKQPVVAHELGQWAVHPDFEEFKEYTGVLKPRNLEQYQNVLIRNGIIDQVKDFQYCSGKFAWLVYKEDMEAALKTPNYGGYFLLSLQDFPGQGEALIGLANSFWRSKGIVTPEEFRRFNDETVALLSFPKAVWTNAETFTAEIFIAHYSKDKLENAVAKWKIQDDAGNTLASGKTLPKTIFGNAFNMGKINLDLKNLTKATHCKVYVSLENTSVQNDWDIWVYPEKLSTITPKDIIITNNWNEAKTMLKKGKKVLFLSRWNAPTKNIIPVDFLPVFWSANMFKQNNIMGLMCNPTHPAFKDFPTESYCNWQWWELTERSTAYILNNTPSSFKPIVQPIDDLHRGNKLGSVIETSVGKGKIIACSYDLEKLDKRPVARQLLFSILNYMNSDAFNPVPSLELKELDDLFNLEPVHLKAQKVSGLKSGLSYTYYEGYCDSLGDIPHIKKLETGIIPDFDIAKVAKRSDKFAISYKGYFSVSNADNYFFNLGSDDGSILKIDGQTIILNDFSHGSDAVNGSVFLKAGFHFIEIEYFEQFGGEALNLFYETKNIQKRPFSSDNLFHKE